MPPPGRPKLRIAVRSFSDFESALAAQIAAYADTQAQIEVISLDLRNLEEVVLGEHGMRSGKVDLAIFPTDWIGAAIRTAAIQNLGALMTARPLPGWPDGWAASLREPLRFGGEFYCIPWHDGPECLIYRKDLFEDPIEQAAFSTRFKRDLAPPATWREFHQTAGFFTRPAHSAQSLYGTLFAACPDGHNTLYDLVLQTWSRGGELYTADGSPSLLNPETIAALDYYRGLIGDPQACYPNASLIDSVQSGDIFLSGQIAMMVNWFGFAARCDRPGSPLQDKVALAPVPGGRPGQSASLSNYWVIGIGAGSEAKQASYDLLRHIATPAMDKLTTLHGAVGVRLSTWNDPAIRTAAPLYSQLERLSAQARTLPFCEDLPALAEIVNQVTIDALNTEEPSTRILARAQTLAVSLNLRLSQATTTLRY